MLTHSLREEAQADAQRNAPLIATLGRVTVALADLAQRLRAPADPSAGVPPASAQLDALQDLLRGTRPVLVQSMRRGVAHRPVCVRAVRSGTHLNPCRAGHTDGRQAGRREPLGVAQLAGRQRPHRHGPVQRGRPRRCGRRRGNLEQGLQHVQLTARRAPHCPQAARRHPPACSGASAHGGGGSYHRRGRARRSRTNHLVRLSRRIVVC